MKCSVSTFDFSEDHVKMFKGTGETTRYSSAVQCFSGKSKPWVPAQQKQDDSENKRESHSQRAGRMVESIILEEGKEVLLGEVARLDIPTHLCQGAPDKDGCYALYDASQESKKEDLFQIFLLVSCCSCTPEAMPFGTFNLLPDCSDSLPCN